MTSLQPFLFAGSDIGLETDVQPYILPDKGYVVLQNGYVFRERVVKRQGLKFLGRLRRDVDYASISNISASGAGTFTFDLFTIFPFPTGEPNQEIAQGSITNITITIATPISQVLTDTMGTGIMSITGSGPITEAVINYATGVLTLTFSGAATASASTFVGGYYPGLPVMGIRPREQPLSTFQQTIFFDQHYAYIFNAGVFIEWIPGTTWNGTDSDFFWTTNYRGSDSSIRLFFETNFVNDSDDPMRYTDGTTWTTFQPALTSSINLYSAKILIPYYGRLLALNTWEGSTQNGAKNFFSRCAFSRIGDPTAADSWRRDIFGRGGSIDAPTAEAIIGATFYKNTLIVTFERSTWQLRYQGDYGIPFIWERISSDFGSESPFSSVLFDQGVLTVGNRAIVSCNASTVDRIDEKIPDLIFDFANANNGNKRISGVRDYVRELVFWSYVDSEFQSTYPNYVLVYNYRNKTFAQFRDNVTAFGTFYLNEGITWDSTTTLWDSTSVTWDDQSGQINYPYIVAGNQQGFVDYYGYTSPDEGSLSITAVSIQTNLPQGILLTITVPNHNLQFDDIIMLNSLNFVAIGVVIPTTLNGQIFRVQEVVDENTLFLSQWSYLEQQYYTDLRNVLPIPGSYQYVGGGQVICLPRLDVQTKDFNPYQSKGQQAFISYIDFLMDRTQSAEMSVNLYIDSDVQESTNLVLGNTELETSAQFPGLILGASQSNPCNINSPQHALVTGNRIQITNVIGMTQLNGNFYNITVVDANNFTLNVDSTGFTAYQSGGNWVTVNFNIFFVPESSYAWHRFFASAVGQFIRVEMTYDANLMNNIVTHQQNWVLNALNMYMKPAGKLVF
jgi:hypothetical protein